MRGPFFIIAVAAVAGAGAGAAMAALGLPAGTARASAEAQLGACFVRGPIEAPEVARARLEGALFTTPGVRSARVRPLETQTSLRVRIEVEAGTSSVAEAAIAHAWAELGPWYRRWHDAEIAGQVRVQQRLERLGARTASVSRAAPGAFARVVDLERQRKNGTRLVLEALRAAEPALSSVEVTRVAPPLGAPIALGAVVGAWLGLAWLLSGALGAGRWGLVLSGALGASLGLSQAEHARPRFEGRATLRAPRVEARAVDAELEAARRLESWIATQARQGRLPYEVRFDAARVTPAGLFAMRVAGDSPGALRRTLEEAVAHGHRLYRSEDLRPAREAQAAQIREQTAALDRGLATASDPEAVQATSDLLLELAASERAAGPVRTFDIEVLAPPRVWRVDAAPRRGPFVVFGAVVGVLLGALLTRRRGGRREVAR